MPLRLIYLKYILILSIHLLLGQCLYYRQISNGRYICVMHVKFIYVFVLDRNFEILILNPRRDRSVTTAKVSSTNQLETGIDLIRSLYF